MISFWPGCAKLELVEAQQATSENKIFFFFFFFYLDGCANFSHYGCCLLSQCNGFCWQISQLDICGCYIRHAADDSFKLYVGVDI